MEALYLEEIRACWPADHNGCGSSPQRAAASGHPADLFEPTHRWLYSLWDDLSTGRRGSQAIRRHRRVLRCFQWVTQREGMYAGVGLVRVGSGSLAVVR
jgi:hypothetical protein